jgi:hypothetical protein
MLEFNAHLVDQQPYRVIHVNTCDADAVLATFQDSHGSTFKYTTLHPPRVVSILTPENRPFTRASADVTVTRKMYKCRVSTCSCCIDAYRYVFPSATLDNRPRHLAFDERWSNDITELRFLDETSQGGHSQALTPRHNETIEYWSLFDASLELVTRIVIHVHPEIRSLDRKVYDRIAYVRRKKRGFGLNDYAATYKHLQTLSPRESGIIYVCGKDPHCRVTCPGILWHTSQNIPLRCECQNEPFTAFEVEEEAGDEPPSRGASSRRTTTKALYRAKWPVILVYCTAQQRQRCIDLSIMKRSMVCDTTFGVTSSGHRLTAIVCVNEFNKVELMASFVTDNLEKTTFEKCFDAWRHWMTGGVGEDVWHPHSFVVDCHDAQLAALKNVFGENVRVQLCSVHVQRAINNRLQRFNNGAPTAECVGIFRRVLHALLYTDVRLDEPDLSSDDLQNFATRAIQTLYKDVVDAARSISTDFEMYIRGEWGVVVNHLNASFVRTSVHTTNAIESFFNGVKTKYMSRRRKRSRYCYDLLDRLKSMADDALSKTRMDTNEFARGVVERMLEEGSVSKYDTESRGHSMSLVSKVWNEYDATSLYVDERSSRDNRNQNRKHERDLEKCVERLRISQATYDAAVAQMHELQTALAAKKTLFVQTRQSQITNSSDDKKMKFHEMAIVRARNEVDIAHRNVEEIKRREWSRNMETDVEVQTAEKPDYLKRIRDCVRRGGVVDHTVDLGRWKCTCSSADKSCPGLNMCVHRVMSHTSEPESIIQRALSWGVLTVENNTSY